jgi:hypothetical protein
MGLKEIIYIDVYNNIYNIIDIIVYQYRQHQYFISKEVDLRFYYLEYKIA